MRTTLTIDDGILKVLKERAHRSNRSFKDVVNETLRLGLAVDGPRARKRFKIKPSALGEVVGGVDLDRSLALADAIEDQELAFKMKLRK